MSEQFDPTIRKPVTRAGEFDLLRRMGAGGFGVVYEARHRGSGLSYALKRIDMSAEDAERYRNEALYPARIAAQSLHVMGVHSFFHDAQDDVFYLVTELVPHGDLRAFLDRQPKPLPLTQGLELGIGIAKGLAAIHAQGIVHRDLKPNNVLMDHKDDVWVPKITDFGLARSSRSVSLGDFATSGYAAPEQLDLMSEQPLGPESDLFSFGMLLYELLTGSKPTPAQELREYGRWIGKRQPPPPPSHVRPELAQWPQIDTLLALLLEFDRNRRLGSAGDALRMLSAIARQVGSQTLIERVRLPHSSGAHTPAPHTPVPPAPPPLSGPHHVVPIPGPAPTPVPALPPAPAPSHTPAPDASPGPWTRTRVALVMIGVFLASGAAMTYGLPWKGVGKEVALEPDSILRYKEVPFIAVVSWVVLPAFFGLAVAAGLRLRLGQAVSAACLSSAAFQLTKNASVFVPGFVVAAFGMSIEWAVKSTPRIVFLVTVGILVVGVATAGLTLAIFRWWQRPTRRTVLLLAAASCLALGVEVATDFLPKLPERLDKTLFFWTWQGAVGTVFVLRSLFADASVPKRGARDWDWKPAASVAGLAVLACVVGSIVRNLPEPQQPGASKTNPKDHLDYAWMPPGEFRMGCSPDDGECQPNEEPGHTVKFTQGFWIGKKEVTVKAWRDVGLPMPPEPEWGGLLYNKGWAFDAYPIINVTWDQASSYCLQIGGRLPTEAEWEYAARAGTTGARWGRLRDVARYADNSGSSPLSTATLSDEALQKAIVDNRNTAADARGSSNAWGLVDVLGNVAEWVQDDYGEGTYALRSADNSTNPSAHRTGQGKPDKVVRGGSWASRPQDVRVSARASVASSTPSVFVGFRCVWSAPPE
jgi:formylglycine-generating enzyme required for sulfatase activity/serine/threonine protein kinase